MQKKKFKTESQKLLDMMINSIYTHKEIFLRELISNASDAIDKLYYRSLTDDSVKLGREDYAIRIEADKEGRNLLISDNGCGMTKDELENNLGICNCVVTKTKVTLFGDRAVKLLTPAFKNIVGGKVVFD